MAVEKMREGKRTKREGSGNEVSKWKLHANLTLLWVGFLGVFVLMWGEGWRGKVPCLKLVRIMLKT